MEDPQSSPEASHTERGRTRAACIHSKPGGETHHGGACSSAQRVVHSNTSSKHTGFPRPGPRVSSLSLKSKTDPVDLPSWVLVSKNTPSCNRTGRTTSCNSS